MTLELELGSSINEPRLVIHLTSLFKQAEPMRTSRALVSQVEVFSVELVSFSLGLRVCSTKCNKYLFYQLKVMHCESVTCLVKWV